MELSLKKNFEENNKTIYSSPHKKVADARLVGMSSFEKTGLPSPKLEKWRSTNLTKMYEQDYIIGDDKPIFDKQINEIFHCNVHGFNTNVFALLNGWYYSSEEDQIQTLDDGVIVGSIVAAQIKHPEILNNILTR